MKAFYKERPKITVSLAVFLLLGIFVMQILYVPLFFVVKKINVSGQAYLSKDDVVVSSGILEGSSLITTSTQKVENQLLTNSWVKEVEVSKKWPIEINIVIKERKPMLAIPYHNNFVIISDDGIVIDIREDFSSVNLPVLNGYVPNTITINSPIMSSNQWQIISEICTSIPSSFLSHLSEIYWYRNEISLYTIDGMKILLGNIENFEPDRLKLLPEIVKHIKVGEKGYLDLSGINAVFRKL